MKKSLPLLLSTITLSIVFNVATADTIITYEFNVDQELQVPTYTPVIPTDPDVESTDINNTSIVGTGGYDQNNGWGISTDHLFVRAGALTSSFQLTPGSFDDYISFTVSTDTGTFDLTGASLDARTSSSFHFTLRSAVDDYATDLFSGSTSSNTYTSFGDTSISGVTGQTTTEFRLFMRGSGSGGDVHRIDNLSLTVVPEPSTLALIGLAGVAGFFVLRRRR
jgi:hypothetical protein